MILTEKYYTYTSLRHRDGKAGPWPSDTPDARSDSAACRVAHRMVGWLTPCASAAALVCFTQVNTLLVLPHQAPDTSMIANVEMHIEHCRIVTRLPMRLVHRRS